MVNANTVSAETIALLNAAPDNYLILLPDSPHFTIIAVTDAYCQVTYTIREAIVGKGVFEVFPDNPNLANTIGENNLKASLQQVLEQRAAHQMRDHRYDLINPTTGAMEYKVWRLYNKPVLNSIGEVAFIIHSVVDITETVRLSEAAKMAQQASEHHRNLVYQLFLHAPIAIAIFKGPDLLIDLANERILALWNQTRDQVINKALLEVLPEVKGQGYERLLKQVLETGEPYRDKEFELQLKRNNRLETTFLDFVFEPQRELDGRISGVVIMAIDITEQVVARKREEQRSAELKAANLELKQANESLESFVYAASHDIKEPIRKIRFFTERLRNELVEVLTESQHEWFNRLELAGLRMGTLIDDLLLYAEVMKGTPELETIDLNVVVHETLEDLELEVHERHAQVKVAALPTIKGYKRQMQQLFQNLISNALKYSKPEIPPLIQITARLVKGSEVALSFHDVAAENLYHLIEVCDNGIGFSQDNTERIFNAFTRLHGNTEYKGSGIGLSTARKVVQKHGGYIWAESEPGVGSTFKILLPDD